MKFEPMPNLGELEVDIKAISWHIDRKDKICPTTGKKPLSDQLHVVVEAVDTDWKNLHLWFLLTNKQDATFHKLTEKLVEIGILNNKDIQSAKDVYELASTIGEKWVKSGKVLHCKKQMIGRSTKPVLFPT